MLAAENMCDKCSNLQKWMEAQSFAENIRPNQDEMFWLYLQWAFAAICAIHFQGSCESHGIML